MIQSLTVIFATFNGEKTLPMLLKGLKALDVRGLSLAIIAVDNGSTDQTNKLLMDAKRDLPLQVFVEPNRGKNKALNRAVPLAGGDLVVFTDDDIVPAADWLQQLARAAEMHVDFDIFGGQIKALWPEEPAKWIIRGVPGGAAFGISEPEWKSGEAHPGRIWGANMAIRRFIFDAGHRFNNDIGPSAGNYIMGSETDLSRRLMGLGHRCFYVSSAEVRHVIRKEQMTEQWLRGRAFRYGRGLFAAECPEVRIEVAELFGAPRWTIREQARSRLRQFLSKLRGDRTNAMRAAWDLEVSRGYVHEWRARGSP